MLNRHRSWLRWSVSGVLAGLMAWASAGNSQAEEGKSDSPVLGRTITELKASDWQGREHTLSEYQAKKILVVAFLGTECPLVKQYASRLNEIREKFTSDGTHRRSVWRWLREA